MSDIWFSPSSAQLETEVWLVSVYLSTLTLTKKKTSSATPFVRSSSPPVLNVLERCKQSWHLLARSQRRRGCPGSLAHPLASLRREFRPKTLHRMPFRHDLKWRMCLRTMCPGVLGRPNRLWSERSCQMAAPLLPPFISSLQLLSGARATLDSPPRGVFTCIRDNPVRLIRPNNSR